MKLIGAFVFAYAKCWLFIRFSSSLGSYGVSAVLVNYRSKENGPVKLGDQEFLVLVSRGIHVAKTKALISFAVTAKLI